MAVRFVSIFFSLFLLMLLLITPVSFAEETQVGGTQYVSLGSGGYYEAKGHSGFLVDGRVGVGTTSPQAELDVWGDIYTTEKLRVGSSSSHTSAKKGANGSNMDFRAMVAGPGLFVNAQSGSNGLFVYRAPELYNQVLFDSSRQYFDWGNNPVVFRQGLRERFRFDSSGKFGLGTPAPEAILHVEGVEDDAIQKFTVKNSQPWSKYETKLNKYGTVGHIVNGRVSFSNDDEDHPVSLSISNKSEAGPGNLFSVSHFDLAKPSSHPYRVRTLFAVNPDGMIWMGPWEDSEGTSNQVLKLYFDAETKELKARIPMSASATDYVTRTIAAVDEPLKVDSRGNIGIGTSNPQALLDVNGNVVVKNILADKIGIGTSSPEAELDVRGRIWANRVSVSMDRLADYVFSPNYSLLSLDKVEAHIQKYNHLPNMPSAKEVAKSGMDLGSMQNKLLEKIEELTLHMIDMNKKIVDQKREISALKQKIGA